MRDAGGLRVAKYWNLSFLPKHDISDADAAARVRELLTEAVRKRLISELPQSDPPLFDAFIDALRQADGESHFVRSSGRYPLCGRGDINTYTIFAENMRTVAAATGRVGVILPIGIATDDTTKFFFGELNDVGVSSRKIPALEIVLEEINPDSFCGDEH